MTEHTQMDATIYACRRARLAAKLGDGVAIVPTAPERIRNRDAHYPYRYDSYFYYLTGFREPEAVLVLRGGAQPQSILFCREKNPEREIWDGYRHGPEAAKDRFGFDETYSEAELDERLPDLLADQPAVHVHLGSDALWDARVLGWINAVRNRARSGVAAPGEIRDVHCLIDDMRLLKDEQEQALMRRAGVISGAAHRLAMQAAGPGVGEYEIEAVLQHEFRRSGAQAPAYTPIVAAGAHACVLHYVENNGVLADGDLLLIDAGCELDGYASDITRTFPVNGRFSGPQRAVYELVLAAQAAAIAAVRPGAHWNAPHDAAVAVLAQGFIDLKLLEGSLAAVLEQETYKQFYMHRTGHWLGLDVHDAGDYKVNGAWRELQPGMVLTVEPGCYIRPGPGVPEAFTNIGVRIEDDALVTAQGCEILSAGAPKSVADIEALMRARHV
ncbi:MAG: aminopeptidase P N-terminal domain-containing protein [Betaproteobacteria bacterium]|jgi:Xaa-Pro aminopeptidase|nr:aminopeptidase P N-terminal domain-containing protein [Betaproteobacteria bacterium]MDH4292716.1 aminopeptidase P N-terminal domain-containing protein [Betaproteobacteria bacterium]MDH5342450.1 aminopeptidase P N-terminal domain-containing protein [Betaproteobacteria bacterium]